MHFSRDEIFRQIDQHRSALRKLGVAKLQLFGSAVRDEAESASDIDFVVSLEENSFNSYMDIKLFLEDLFCCPVDLVLADTIKPLLRTGILQEAVHAPGF